MESELENLRREREEKVKQIAEKRRQVEELKRRRAERTESRKDPLAPRVSVDLGRSVDSLVAEILGGDVASGAPRPSPEGALKEIAQERAAGGGQRERALHLQLDRVAVVTVEPSEADNYDRATQTEVSGDIAGKKDEKELTKAPAGVLLKMAAQARNRVVKADSGNAQQGLLRKRTVDVKEDQKVEQKEVKELTKEEQDRIEKNKDFQSFFERSTLLVERILGQQSFDVAADFRTSSAAGGGAQEDDSACMKYLDDYVEERWARNRPITDTRFSPHQKEMFLAAYGQKENPSLSDPDGCMLVWNLAMKTRPEITFSCPSAVLTAHFHRFDPSLFFGATYSGAIVLWDARAKAGPVLRTPLSGKGHSHPVQAMQQVGTQNATNLVTASNDGRLCVWSLSMLNLPQSTIDLKNETKNRRDLAVMTLSFPENETNTLYTGSEDGTMCQVHIHGSKVGVTECYDGHEGPVTGVEMHPHQDAAQYGVADTNFDIALTCSFDWSVKLWMVKQYQSCVLSLDNFEDYVYDAKWHPLHPAVFASVDGEGHVDLWNLNSSIESPQVHMESPHHRKLALNHCHWSNDGRNLVTGDSEGNLAVYAVDKSIAQPRDEDFKTFQEKVRSFQPLVPRSVGVSSLSANRAVGFAESGRH